MQKVQFTETILRDANQSLVATRLPFNKFEPILSTIDQAGFYSVECWGGATFDSCMRFLKEDPWDRLRKLRDGFKNTKLQRGDLIHSFVVQFLNLMVFHGSDVIFRNKPVQPMAVVVKAVWQLG